MPKAKRNYQVTTYYANGNEVKRLGVGVGVEKNLYTYRTAVNLLNAWKDETAIIRGVLLLDGNPIEQWERTGKERPQTHEL